MKYITMLSFCLLLFCSALQAQPPGRDTLHRDTTLFGFGQAKAVLIHAPILLGSSQGINIVANRQQFCFDLTMEIELFYGGRRSLETCLFINTTDGYIGYTQPSMGGSINMLIPEIESFRFTIMSFKLNNIYTYFNQKANHDILNHLVSTSNTDTHEYQMNNLLTATPLSRKSERRTYCSGKAEALAYKRSDEPTTWFIYGDRYPQSLQCQKFLGVFGVGVVKTDAGCYIVMERQAGSSYTVIKHIERTHICFDPTGFKMQEADFYTKRTADLQAESDKIDRDEADAQKQKDCVAERMAEINYRREVLRLERDNLRKAQQGNLMQDRTAQKGMIDLMDPLISLRQGILSIKTGICALEVEIGKHPERSEQAHSKLTCLTTQLANLNRAESEMQAADIRYASNIALASVEKSRIYYRVMSSGCN